MTGVEYLGGCSFTSPYGEYTPDVCAAEHCMKERALDDLNQTIADAYADLEPLLASECGCTTT
jgi:hypothetical protein